MRLQIVELLAGAEYPTAAQQPQASRPERQKAVLSSSYEAATSRSSLAPRARAP